MLLRRAARLLVVDSDGAVLLFQYEDGGERWWATPGGGLEGEETFEAAAAREAEEELALLGVVFAPLWENTVEFTFRGQAIQQFERYFLLRRPRSDLPLGESVREVHSHEGILATRWWSLEELRETTERFYPDDLCERLQGLQR